MRKWTLAVSGLLLGGLVLAQERIPQEQAQKAAAMLAEHAAKLDGPQIKTEVDAQKPFGLQQGQRAAVIIPDKKLSEDALSKAGKDVVPLGQLWLRGLAPVADGKVLPNDKLRVVKVKADNQDHELPLCLLGVRKNKDGGLEMVVYGKDKEPLLSVPLKKMDVKQELPLELEAKRGDNETAQVLVSVLGKYQASLTVGRQQ